MGDRLSLATLRPAGDSQQQLQSGDIEDRSSRCAAASIPFLEPHGSLFAQDGMDPNPDAWNQTAGGSNVQDNFRILLVSLPMFSNDLRLSLDGA
jgi:hypothetical protein